MSYWLGTIEEFVIRWAKVFLMCGVALSALFHFAFISFRLRLNGYLVAFMGIVGVPCAIGQGYTAVTGTRLDWVVLLSALPLGLFLIGTFRGGQSRLRKRDSRDLT